MTKFPPVRCRANDTRVRYHKSHGHSNQLLHENGDGTFSIMNPETSTPYPGTLGMEKQKPFSCETCHKRYKNLNGLKYVRFLARSDQVVLQDEANKAPEQHRQHSPQCDPEMRQQQQNLLSTMVQMGGLNMGLHRDGLPNIGEDLML